MTVKTTLNENAVLVRICMKKKSLVSFGFSFFFNKGIELTGQELYFFAIKMSLE